MLFLAENSENTWNFPGGERNKGALCYVNEMTLGPHLRSGLVARVGRGLELSRGRGEGLEGERVADGQRFPQPCLCKKASIKPGRTGFGRLLVGEHLGYENSRRHSFYHKLVIQ